VDKASTAYTQMQAALAKAKTDLLGMQQAAGETGEELQKVADSGDSAADSLKSIDKGIKFQNVTSSLEKVEGVLKNILKKAVDIGTTIWDWGKDASEWADTLITDATKYGMDVETLQRWQAAADAIDTSVEDIIKANDKLMKSYGGEKTGVALITTEMGQYGIAIKDANGQMRDQMDVFWDFIDVIRNVESETERNALAQEIFGKSYRDLLPLIEKGRDGWEEASSAASYVTEENVNKLGELNDKLNELDQKWQTTKMTLLANLAPAFEKIADALEHMMDLLGDWAASDEGQATITKLGEAVANLITDFANGGFEKMFEGATGALEKIADFLSKITSGEILDGIKKIAEAFLAIKFSEAFLRGANLLRSFGFGGSGTSAGAAGAAGASATSSAATTAAYSTPLWLRLGRGFGTGLLVDSLGNILNQSGSESAAWGTAAGVGALINPFLGAGIGALDMLVGGHTANDEAVQRYAELGTNVKKYKGYYAEDWRGGHFTLQDLPNNDVGLEYDWELKPNLYTGEVAQRLAKVMGEGFMSDDVAQAYYNMNRYGYGPDMPIYQLYKTQSQWNDGILAWMDAEGNMYTQYIEDINGWLDEMEAAVDEYEKALEEQQEAEKTGATVTESITEGASEAAEDAGTSVAESLYEGAEAKIEDIFAVGEQLAAAMAEGIMANLAAAYNAGAALAGAFAQGAGGGGGSSSTSYNSSYVGEVNFYGSGSPAEIAAAYNEFTQQTRAGYGG